MMATKVNVAFQTMPQTVATSDRPTTPVASATSAPALALQPIPRPRGWAITSVSVAMKIRMAITVMNDPETKTGPRCGPAHSAVYRAAAGG